MRRWIVLLRGINVSGQKKIIMSELRQLVAEYGYHDVQTYIQSGNLIFSANDRASQQMIQGSISELIRSNYGFDVAAFAINPNWLEEVTKNNPFLKNRAIDTKQLYLGIFDQPPATDKIARLNEFETSADEYILQGRVIYLNYRNGAGKSKLTNQLIESRLKVQSTLRNWNTTMKLLELSQAK